MNLRELLEVLEMDSVADFQYFEDLEQLILMTDEIPYETLCQFIRGVDFKVLSRLLRDFFEEIEKGVPDSQADFYALLENIKLALSGMAAQMEDESEIAQFCDELDRFRRWYMEGGEVLVRALDESVVPEAALTMSRTTDGKGFFTVTPEAALTMFRASKLIGEEGEYEYDFGPALGYELREYIMSFRDALEASEDIEEE